MIRGFYTALSGIIANMTRQDVVADAIANVNTPGFKQNLTHQADFGMELSRSAGGAIGELGTATVATGLTVDPTPGALEITDVPTDLAVEGDGLFVVNTGTGIAYTRAGDFVVDAAGTLVTKAGQPVLDTTGKPIVAPKDAALRVDADGTVAGTGQKIALVAWPASGMIRLGGNLYAAPGVQPAATGAIRQGALEHSNVDLAAAMTDLMTYQRSLALDSRALSIQYDTTGETAVLGRLK